jgi:hypothetical protein
VAFVDSAAPVICGADGAVIDGPQRAVGCPRLAVGLGAAQPAAAVRRRGDRLAVLVSRRTAGAARLVGDVVEVVGVVGTQEVQGKDSNNHDQHDHGHKDNQDRSDHHTIPLIWPWGGASQTRAAICASLPRKCKHPSFIASADPLEQRLCRTLYALSRNSGTLTKCVGYLYLCGYAA